MMLFTKLKDSDFIIHRDFFSHGIHFIELSTINHGIRCPSCHAFITKVKEYRLKQIVHDIYEHSHAMILFRRRRFICPHCRHTIMEENPFSSVDSNISDFTILAILDELKRYNVPFLQVACRHDLSVTKIQTIFDSYVDLPRNPLPDVLCMDEFYFSRKRDKKYCLIMIDFYNHVIIDILKDRTKHTMLAYFRSIDLQERSSPSILFMLSRTFRMQWNGYERKSCAGLRRILDRMNIICCLLKISIVTDIQKLNITITFIMRYPIGENWR